jgi:Tol biopolymer transport system component
VLTSSSPATFAWRPQWSPRGGAIAYLDQVRHGALVTVDPRTRRTRVLASGSDGLSAPSWSPDGRMIVFATAGHHIEIVAADGSARRTITHGIADDADPVWQPRR